MGALADELGKEGAGVVVSQVMPTPYTNAKGISREFIEMVRKSNGAVSANFHESVAVEIAWTVVPFLIVIGMALPATKVLVAQKDTTGADLTTARDAVIALVEAGISRPTPDEHFNLFLK